MKGNRLFLLVILVVSVLLFTGLTRARAAEKIKFGLPNKANPLYMLPNYAAEQQGIWKQHGLKVEFSPFKGGGAMARAIAAGGINVGIHSTISIVRGVSRGLPVVSLADLETIEEHLFSSPETALSRRSAR
ncbi:MAG: ABC transporter substrate-binding protein [Thermodesulfobacteriota bacterium]